MLQHVMKSSRAVLAVGLVPGEVEPPLMDKPANMYQAEL
jgi:hypothetical protein